MAITINLALQLCSGGIFIPERISVDCYLGDLTKEFTILPVEADHANSLLAGSGKDKVVAKLGGVLVLTAESCRKVLASGSSGEHHGESLFPTVTLDIPKDLDGEFNLMLMTTINVFDSIVLGDYESGLTCPKILYDLGKIRRGTRIMLEYHIGDRSGFKYRSL